MQFLKSVISFAAKLQLTLLLQYPLLLNEHG